MGAGAAAWALLLRSAASYYRTATHMARMPARLVVVALFATLAPTPLSAGLTWEGSLGTPASAQYRSFHLALFK